MLEIAAVTVVAAAVDFAVAVLFLFCHKRVKNGKFIQFMAEKMKKTVNKMCMMFYGVYLLLSLMCLLSRLLLLLL